MYNIILFKTNISKSIKIKKAYEGIKKFVSNLPNALVTGTVIINKVEELYSKLKPFIER